MRNSDFNGTGAPVYTAICQVGSRVYMFDSVRMFLPSGPFSKLSANIRNTNSLLFLLRKCISRKARGSRPKEVEPRELFFAPASRSRQTLAYIGAATQLIFWGNLAQWAGTGYAVKDKETGQYHIASPARRLVYAGWLAGMGVVFALITRISLAPRSQSLLIETPHPFMPFTKVRVMSVPISRLSLSSPVYTGQGRSGTSSLPGQYRYIALNVEGKRIGYALDREGHFQVSAKKLDCDLLRNLRLHSDPPTPKPHITRRRVVMGMSRLRVAKAIGAQFPILTCRIRIGRGVQANFSHASILRASSPFKMPAMSPTMTEGSIASWKIKEGESFHAGDVLLEIETDKAQMDVEAQEDGVLAKVLVPAGTHNVKVGKPIAVLAEEGDDISLVELPAEDTESLTQTSHPKFEEATRPKEEQSLQTSPKSEISSNFATLYSPSVFRLLQEYNVEDPKLIQATGPHGRLLKGDVLAYVGNIDKDIPKQLREVLAKKQKLDLSNVAIQKVQSPLQLEAQTFVPPPSEPTIPAQIVTIVRLTRLMKLHRGLSEAFSLEFPLSSLIEKASRQALGDVPQFGLRKPPTTDIIFAELIGEYPEIQNRQSISSSLTLPPQCAGDQEPTPFHLDIEKVYGSIRVKDILGEAILHFEPVDITPVAPYSDPFDIILGANQTVKASKPGLNEEHRQDVRVRLEYDDAVIADDAAAAYITRFQYHLECASHLVLTH